MIEPTALLVWARVDIKPPYTAFGTLGDEMKMTAPSGTPSIYKSLPSVGVCFLGFPAFTCAANMRAGVRVDMSL
mgnify:CR=1 FL=1